MNPSLIAALVITVGVIGLVVTLLTGLSGGSDSGQTYADSTTTTSSYPTGAAPFPTSTTTGLRSTSPRTSSPSTNSSGAMPSTEDEAYAFLESAVREDSARATSSLEGRWSPQISSKKLGLVAEGKTWTYRDIVQQYVEFGRRYESVLLLDSSDWSVFIPGYYVMIVDHPTDSSESVLSWCRAQGLGRDDCLAKRVLEFGSQEGNTRLQR